MHLRRARLLMVLFVCGACLPVSLTDRRCSDNADCLDTFLCHDSVCVTPADCPRGLAEAVLDPCLDQRGDPCVAAPAPPRACACEEGSVLARGTPDTCVPDRCVDLLPLFVCTNLVGEPDPNCTCDCDDANDPSDHPTCGCDAGFVYDAGQDACVLDDAALAEILCTHLLDCIGVLDDGTCAASIQAQLDGSAAEGSALCTQMHEALVEQLRCQVTASCVDLNADTACFAERAVSEELGSQGAFPCLSGLPPIEIPAAWTCPARFFGVGDGCDCGCGAVDADCVGASCTAAGCQADACAFCYVDDASAVAGTFVTCDNCFLDAGCPAGHTCETIDFFGVEAPSCFADCAPEGGGCLTTNGAAGQCASAPLDGQAALICVSSAANLRPCGNAANALCADTTASCVNLGDDVSTPQNEAALLFCANTCALGVAGSCADVSEECSAQFLFASPDGAPIGLCAPTSQPGATCGATADSLALCTGAQTCAIAADEDVGTCSL